jgi:CHAT domain-containing protein
VVVAGPDLPGAAAEATAVAAIYGGTPLTGAGATVDAVAKVLDGATLAHLATHGLVRSDNPLFSALRFADGPLMLHDLEALSRAPDTVVLAACETGRPVVLAGDELMGLGATLLAHGTRRLVAPVIDVLDIETAPLMVAFHRLLATGAPAATALAAAQQAAADAHPAGLAAVAPFICLGAC